MEAGQSRSLGDTVAVTKRERIGSEVLHRRAQVAVLTGLGRVEDVYDLMAAAGPCHVPGRFPPDVALLELAVTALDLACPAGAEPVEYEGLRERFLPEVTFRGRVERRNSQYALYAAACMRGGLQPDLLSDAGWWQSRLWQYTSTPSSSTAGKQQSASAFHSRRSPGGSPPGITLISRTTADRADQHGEVAAGPIRCHGAPAGIR